MFASFFRQNFIYSFLKNYFVDLLRLLLLFSFSIVLCKNSVQEGSVFISTV